jgi:pyridoxamine 5'-phosphate oxidase
MVIIISHGDAAVSPADPLQILDGWIEEAREAKVPAPAAMTLATVAGDGRPSARVVSLKRLEPGALVFTTSLWTRKAEELRGDPRVAAVFHWPSLGRQVRIEGRAEIAERGLAEELWAGRPRSHQLQVLVSRQGEEIEDLDSLRSKLRDLERGAAGRPVACPDEWGAIRIRAESVELWEEGGDRLHDRLLYEPDGEAWRGRRLAP